MGKSTNNIGSVKSVNIDGIELSYRRDGHASKAVIFLHGNSSTKEVFQAQFKHYHNKELTLIAVDLPGHGKSGNAPNPELHYTIPGYARIISKFLETLNINDFIIVGWSLGGNIAVELVGQTNGGGCSPKAILIMGAPPLGPGPENFEKAYLPIISDMIISKNDATKDELEIFTKAIYGTLSPIPEQFFEAAYRTDGRAREIMEAHWLGSKDGYDQLETVLNWTKSICVVHGIDDPFVSLDYLKNTKWGSLWDGKIIEIPDCGHAPFIENSIKFNAILDNFISDIF